MSNCHLGLEFEKRAAGLPEKLTEFALCQTSLPFCDIRRDRNGGPPQLRSKPESFGTGEFRSLSIDMKGELFSFIPYQKFAICPAHLCVPQGNVLTAETSVSKKHPNVLRRIPNWNQNRWGESARPLKL